MHLSRGVTAILASWYIEHVQVLVGTLNLWLGRYLISRLETIVNGLMVDMSFNCNRELSAESTIESSEQSNVLCFLWRRGSRCHCK